MEVENDDDDLDGGQRSSEVKCVADTSLGWL